MLAGLMSDQPLLVSAILTHAERWHGRRKVVSRLSDGTIHRQTIADTAARARRLASLLRSLGIEAGDRVGTLAWNTHRHLEAYYAIAGIGAVCHTINPRLHPDQLVYMMNHAGDRLLLADACFKPLIEQISPRLRTIERILFLDHGAAIGACDLPVLAVEDALTAVAALVDWPRLPEHAACGLCYTSGTTGEPKGALYSHRSTVLMSYALSLPDVAGLSARDVVMPVVPMFHVNAWSLPYAALMNGSAMVLPGQHLDGASLAELIRVEGVTFTAGVPTVWLGLFRHLDEAGGDLKPLERVLVGGSAAPAAMIRRFRDDYGVELRHAWGMTELSPLGTSNTDLPDFDGLDDEARLALLSKQGRALFGIDMRIVDDEGRVLAHDGTTFGNLEVRGPWVASSYFKSAASEAFGADGWFRTGDVATIDPHGLMQIVDRTKDVIKSGGEWISSIELENLAVAHPAILEAAAIAAEHPRWSERPVLIIVPRPASAVSEAEMLAHLARSVPKWWLPDRVIVAEELPHGATGKILKSALRERYGQVLLAEVGG